MFDEGYAVRAWKGHNWEHLDRPNEKGYIDNPKSKVKSVIVTEGACCGTVQEIF